MPAALIADHHAVTREAVGEVLSHNGYRVQKASCAKDAVAAVMAQQFDVILTELDFPDKAGEEYLKAIRAARPAAQTPLVILSEVSERSRILGAVEFGVSGYLLKQQFTVEMLLKKLEAALRKGAPAAVPIAKVQELKQAEKAPPPAAIRACPESTLAELKPILTRSELQELIEGFGELRALSPTVAQLIKLTSSPRVSMDSIVQAIRVDHAVALKIIKLANSAVYSRGDPVNSVKTAVLRIGTEQIRQAVMNISVIDRFGSAEFAEHILQGPFWEHAIGCGIIAAELARASGAVEPDSAFTMGLLHDVGQLVLGEQLGQKYLDVLQTANRLNAPLEQVEKRMLLTDHAEIMDKLLHAWNFPRDLIDPIVFHHLSAGNIRKIATNKIGETCTVALANRIASALFLGGSGNTTIYATEDLCEALRIEARHVQAIEEVAPDETDEIKLAMLSVAGDRSWTPSKDVWRSRIQGEFRPLFVSTRPGIDAVRIACDRLRDRSPAPPNLGVVHLSHAREKVPLTTALRAAESEARVKNLPLLLISPAGQLTLEQRALEGRSVVQMPIPFTLAQFTQAVSSLLHGEQLAAA